MIQNSGVSNGGSGCGNSSVSGGGGSSGGCSNNHDNNDHRKQNHCEIEKRRRDKMNHYIMQLASAIPSFSNNQSKLDKLTVLRMAVQHVKSLRSSLCSFSSFHLRPSFLSSGNLLKNLILQMASQEAQDNLFMVVTCDRGKVLFVSRSSKDILNQEQDELVGQCLFDILHKDDVSKVKEQISYFSLMPKEMLVDSKTLQPIKHNQRSSFAHLQNQSNSTPQPGARRSFFCRMKSGRTGQTSSTSSSAAATTTTQTHQASSGTKNDDAHRPGINKLPENDLISATTNDSHSQQANTRDSRQSQSITRNNDSNKRKSKANNKTSSNRLSINGDCDNKRSSSSPESSGKNHKGERTKTQYNHSSNNVGESEGNNNQLDSDDLGRISNNRSNDSSEGSRSENEGQNEQSTCNETLSSSSSSNKISDTASDTNSKVGSDADGGSSYTKTSSLNSNGDTMGAENRGNISFSSSRKKQLRYVVMHCTGYLKSITLRNDEFDDDDFDDCNSDNNNSDDDENDSCRTVNCLVAVCRRSVMDRDLKPDRPLTFTCRYSMEGKFVFVDQRTTIALGYTPQQLLGTSHYAYCHEDSVNTFKECHRRCILNSEAVSSDIYQFKRSNGQHMWLQTSLKSFRNPWTKFIDYIVANHTTAEGNDPRYNEGCVPTKFNQDMTGEAPQSSSPASSSSISSPSDSKKSSSPSASSIGSSYSLESYTSGGSIQALLNQIDRVKSGDKKFSLDFHRKRGDGRHAVRSSGSGSSAKKSNEDSGNFSDLQSCSSVSSQNSGLSTEFINLQQSVNFVNSNTITSVNNNNNSNSLSNSNTTNQQQAIAVANSFYNSSQKVQAPHFKPVTKQQAQCGQTEGDYQQQQLICPPPPPTSAQHQQINSGYPNSERELGRTNVGDKDDTTNPNRMTAARVSRPIIGSIKPNQRPTYQYPYRQNQTKNNGSTNSSDSGHDSGTWSNSSGSMYSTESSGHQGVRQQAGTNQTTSVITKHQIQHDNGDHRHQQHQQQHHQQQQQAYVMQTQLQPQIQEVMQTQVSMHASQGNYGTQCAQEAYPNSMLQPVGNYLTTTNNDTRYNTNEVNLDHMGHIDAASGMQQGMTISMNPQQHPRQQSHPGQGGGGGSNIPMIWNTTGQVQSFQDVNMIHPSQLSSMGTIDHHMGNTSAIASNQMMVTQQQQQQQQQMIQCPQCANHKCCSNQPIMMTNNGDLNSINLTSLAVEGDLDEVELLECLAACEPSETTQLYQSLQSNTYSQYNI